MMHRSMCYECDGSCFAKDSLVLEFVTENE
jgi:hypothetical protein